MTFSAVMVCVCVAVDMMFHDAENGLRTNLDVVKTLQGCKSKMGDEVTVDVLVLENDDQSKP